VLFKFVNHFNPLNGKLNRICHLLALLGAHLILHQYTVISTVHCCDIQYTVMISTVHLLVVMKIIKGARFMYENKKIAIIAFSFVEYLPKDGQKKAEKVGSLPRVV
jgi:hypothetical protein